jgi:hypothetical protein
VGSFHANCFAIPVGYSGIPIGPSIGRAPLSKVSPYSPLLFTLAFRNFALCQHFPSPGPLCPPPFPFPSVTYCTVTVLGMLLKPPGSDGAPASASALLRSRLFTSPRDEEFALSRHKISVVCDCAKISSYACRPRRVCQHHVHRCPRSNHHQHVSLHRPAVAAVALSPRA